MLAVYHEPPTSRKLSICIYKLNEFMMSYFDHAHIHLACKMKYVHGPFLQDYSNSFQCIEFKQRLYNINSCPSDYPRSTNCMEGDVRLTYRVSNSIGQVEVCVGNTWNAVCRDNGWGEQEADVVCRQLGFVEPPGEMLILR